MAVGETEGGELDGSIQFPANIQFLMQNSSTSCDASQQQAIFLPSSTPSDVLGGKQAVCLFNMF